MSTPRTAVQLVAERLIHTAEALGLSSDPKRKEAADRYRKLIERQLEKDLKRAAEEQLQPA